MVVCSHPHPPARARDLLRVNRVVCSVLVAIRTHHEIPPHRHGAATPRVWFRPRGPLQGRSIQPSGCRGAGGLVAMTTLAPHRDPPTPPAEAWRRVARVAKGSTPPCRADPQPGRDEPWHPTADNTMEQQDDDAKKNCEYLSAIESLIWTRRPTRSRKRPLSYVHKQEEHNLYVDRSVDTNSRVHCGQR